MNLDSLTIPAIRSSLFEKKHSSVELVKEFYRKIQSEDPGIHVFSHFLRTVPSLKQHTWMISQVKVLLCPS